ncbi:hypothetical protein AbraIFM66950_008207 [Aspergillus brasiliensis]|nr:hypothetical protein AbraIFM66950_008207 [Aspergillus brasiliensis]
MAPQYKVLILDLGNVVFDWLTEPIGETKQLLRQVMKSPLYSQYECGLIPTEQEFCERLGPQQELAPSTIENALQVARLSLVANTALREFIGELQQRKCISVYAMSNIPKSDIDYLHRTFPHQMAMFDGVFASGYMGLRKPDIDFYKAVIGELHCSPESIVFVDDKEQNVDSARSRGWYGVQYQNMEQLRSQLNSLFMSN